MEHGQERQGDLDVRQPQQRCQSDSVDASHQRDEQQMIARNLARRRAPQARQSGFILVTGLLFLVVLTLLGLAMFRSSGLMDRITANTRDKQRSFEASQSAL